MSKIDEELIEKIGEVLEKGFSDNTLKSIRKKFEDILYEVETDLEYTLKENLRDNLSYYVVEMAGKAVTALLAGDEQKMKDYLSCNDYNYTGRKSIFISQGILTDYEPIKLRKDIVNAFPELLKNERILDLEAQVLLLTQEVLKEQARAEEIYRRFNN